MSKLDNFIDSTDKRLGGLESGQAMMCQKLTDWMDLQKVRHDEQRIVCEKAFARTEKVEERLSAYDSLLDKIVGAPKVTGYLGTPTIAALAIFAGMILCLPGVR